MTMYIEATRLTIGLESEVPRSRLLINREGTARSRPFLNVQR